MKKSFSCILILVGIFFSGSVSAQPELDTSFNGTGTVDRGTSFTFLPADAAVQPDNKPIALSSCRNTSIQAFQFCFIRLNENASFDTTFHNPASFSEPGTALVAVPGSNPDQSVGGRGLLVLEDGKILAVGSANFSGADKPVLLRLNSNGTLDSTFGTGGILIFNTGNYFTKAALQPDGKIVVAGNSGSNQLAARFLPDGTPDDTFGDNGSKVFINPSGGTSGYSIALQPDGKIVIGGALASTPVSYLLTRINSDGSLDTSFDDDGYKSFPLNGSASDGFGSIAVKSDGRIVALGYRNILYQLNPNGSPDTSFDSDGTRSSLSASSVSTRLLVSASGRITVVGFKEVIFGNGPWNYLIARYLPNGSPDTNFSGDGFLDVNATEYPHDGADAVAFDTQGRLFIAGRSWNGGGDYPWQFCHYSAARLVAPPAQNVGFSGLVTNRNGKPVIGASIILKNGADVIGYARTNQFGYFNFNNIPTNRTYKLSAGAKNLSFNDQNLLVDDRITNFLVVSRQ